LRGSADSFDEARSWLEQPMDADDLRELLMAVKAALEEHQGPLCSGDLASLADAERVHAAEVCACEDSHERAPAPPLHGEPPAASRSLP
jgi:hypothetical protein